VNALPALNAHRLILSDKQMTRMVYRIALFQRRGWTPQHSEHWADRLADRDMDRDERRLCIECANLQRSGICFAATQGKIPGVAKNWTPVQDILQRCTTFKFQIP